MNYKCLEFTEKGIFLIEFDLGYKIEGAIKRYLLSNNCKLIKRDLVVVCNEQLINLKKVLAFNLQDVTYSFSRIGRNNNIISLRIVHKYGEFNVGLSNEEENSEDYDNYYIHNRNYQEFTKKTYRLFATISDSDSKLLGQLGDNRFLVIGNGRMLFTDTYKLVLHGPIFTYENVTICLTQQLKLKTFKKSEVDLYIAIDVNKLIIQIQQLGEIIGYIVEKATNSMSERITNLFESLHRKEYIGKIKTKDIKGCKEISIFDGNIKYTYESKGKDKILATKTDKFVLSTAINQEIKTKCNVLPTGGKEIELYTTTDPKFFMAIDDKGNTNIFP